MELSSTFLRRLLYGGSTAWAGCSGCCRGRGRGRCDCDDVPNAGIAVRLPAHILMA